MSLLLRRMFAATAQWHVYILYSDGTFVMNEDPDHRESNIVTHGPIVKEYDWDCEREYTRETIPWHNEAEQVIYVEVDNEIIPKYTSYVFADMINLEDIINLNNIVDSELVKMDYWFDNCRKLTSIDFTVYNVMEYIESAEGLFRNCTNLSNCYFSDVTFSNVRNLSSMFEGCSSLTYLEFEFFETQHVTTMQAMFKGCSSLTSADLWNFDTSNVTTMKDMFNGCSNFIMNVGQFNTSNVTDMSGMFSGCERLTSLSITSFNTSNVTNMQDMFNGCTKLKKISARNTFVVDQVTSSNNMFNNCTALVGGNGTAYSSSNPTDKTYAHIDVTGNPGYFTAA